MRSSTNRWRCSECRRTFVPARSARNHQLVCGPDCRAKRRRRLARRRRSEEVQDYRVDERERQRKCRQKCREAAVVSRVGGERADPVAATGHAPASDGHGPASNGHGPAADGHGPAADGHGPASDGHGLASDDQAPGPGGHAPALALPGGPSPPLGNAGSSAQERTPSNVREDPGERGCHAPALADNVLKIKEKIGEIVARAMVVSRASLEAEVVDLVRDCAAEMGRAPSPGPPVTRHPVVASARDST